MMKLDDREWKPFELYSIFKVSHGKRLTKEYRLSGKTPLITAGFANQGVADFISNDQACYDNAVTIDMFCNSFYKPFSVIGDDNIYFIQSTDINQYTGAFISVCIANQSSVYNYGKQVREKVLKRFKIMLPVTNDGQPDYQFMEDYIRELMAEKKKQYREYVKQRIAELCAGSDSQQVDLKSMIDSHEWAPFQIDTIFNILPGKRLVAADSNPGDRPFIGALDNSNGVARFVSDKNGSLDKNVLGVNYNGNGMVIGFYHPYECIFSDDVKRFHLKHYEDNQFVLLFLKACILLQKKKFGYLYKFNAERMAHTSIMLPVSENGMPDYAFMELCGKLMFARKYKQYLLAIGERAG